MLVTAEIRDMLAEAGFEPCWIKDLANDDVISIEHVGKLTEMTVTQLWQFSVVTKKWIGVLTDGRKIHCSYATDYECWRRTC